MIAPHISAACGPSRFLRNIVMVLSALATASAIATTDTEDKIRKAPMPHQTVGTAGTMVKVHLTRLEGYIEGKPDNAARLVQLKAMVQECVQQGPLGGGQPRPPQAWPDFIASQRSDEYASANSSIIYTWTLGYGINPGDCSLLEVQSRRARLRSSLGSCDIDLVEKTARGVCDGKVHASAPPPERVAPSSMSDVQAAQQRHPGNAAALAALAAAMRQHANSGTGVRKTILGLPCEVWQNPLDAGGTVCLSMGGSFVAQHATGEQRYSSMVLEMTSPEGINMRAIDARLDTMVNAAVFAPHQAEGFTMIATGARK